MNDRQVDALLEAAREGVDFDDLRAGRGADGYRLATSEVDEAGLSVDAFREAAREAANAVTNWYFWTRGVDVDADARYAFLRWLERAGELPAGERYGALESGYSRSWGQLRITPRLGDHGARRYDVRHEDDADADAAGLERYDDPLDAREVAKFDDRGRYRPLSTAPTLASGWVFPDLPPADLCRVVDFVYPATVENWHLERRGELDVTHWQDAASRQTGIYAVVSELPDEALPRAVGACCADDACLKRRRWDRSEADPIDVPRGDGEFPCREPCSLFVAAAREWSLEEGGRDAEGHERGNPEADRRDEPETTIHLSEEERDQLRAVLDAAAEGRIDDVPPGAVDDPANRYRVRYLRAKLRNRLGGSDDPA